MLGWGDGRRRREQGERGDGDRWANGGMREGTPPPPPVNTMQPVAVIVRRAVYTRLCPAQLNLASTQCIAFSMWAHMLLKEAQRQRQRD